MTSKKIYLIRHGQTDFNLKRIVQGSGVNSSLNDTGRLQAQAFYRKYKDLPFDNIYTSALTRTIETVQPFLNDGYEHEPMVGLNEIHWGNKEGLQVADDSDSTYNKVIELWRSGNISQKMEEGESPEEVALRLKNAMKVILSREDEEQILICMHGRAMRILLCLLLNYPIHCMDYFPHQNTSLYQLFYTGKLTRINLFNDVSHFDLMKE